MSEDIFSSVDNVSIPKPTQKTNDPYLGDGGNGDYTVELVKAKYFQKNDGKRFVFATVKILTAPAGSAFEPGDTATHSIPLFSKFKDTWQKELKFFVASWFDVAADEVDGKACELFTSDKQPATGRKAKVTVEKKDGKTFAKTRWRALKA